MWNPCSANPEVIYAFLSIVDPRALAAAGLDALAGATCPALVADAALWLAEGTAVDLPEECVETDFAGALRVAGTAADATGTAFEIPETDIMGTFFLRTDSTHA